jgi:protein disulfide-isomerase-like protein
MNLQKMFNQRAQQFSKILKPSNMPRLLFLLAVLLVLYIVYERYLKEGFESDASTLDDKLDNSITQMVLFHADWCGHCKKLMPEWDKAAKEMNKGGKMVMIKVDAGGKDAETQVLVKKYGVDGFPTIIIFKDGQWTPYTGERTKEGLLSALA